MAKVNWKEARRWYVLGGIDVKHIGMPNKATGSLEYPTMQSIADFYDVTIQTICTKSKKENWIDRRAQAQEELDEKISKRLTDLGIKSLIEVNAEHAKIADAVVGLYTKQLIPKTDKDGNPIKPMFVTSYDVMQFIKLRQEISEKASGIENDVDKDALSDYIKKVLDREKGE